MQGREVADAVIDGDAGREGYACTTHQHGWSGQGITGQDAIDNSVLIEGTSTFLIRTLSTGPLILILDSRHLSNQEIASAPVQRVCQSVCHIHSGTIQHFNFTLHNV